MKNNNLINKNYAEKLHEGLCNKPFIIKYNKTKIEKYNFLTKRYYIQYNWKCLNCGWESDMITEKIKKNEYSKKSN